MSPRKMLFDIPPELKIAIAHYVRLGDVKSPRPLASLQSLSLTSKAWSIPAQIALYHCVELATPARINQFRTALRTFSSFASYVAVLHFGRPTHTPATYVDSPLLDIEDVFELAALLPNLSTLEIHGVPFEACGSGYLISPQLRWSIETMEIIDGTLRTSAVQVMFYEEDDTTEQQPGHQMQSDSGTTRLVSILQPFMQGTLESLRIPDCPLVGKEHDLVMLAASLKGGLGRNLTELELNLAGRDPDDPDVTDIEGSGSRDVTSDSDAFGPIARFMSPITLRDTCPRLKSLTIAIPLFTMIDAFSTEMLPEWRYALRLMASTHPASLTHIRINFVCYLPSLVGAAVSDTLFSTLNWAHLDKVVSRYSNLEAIEFKPQFGTECGIQYTGSTWTKLPKSFKLDRYLEERMPGAAARGILHVGPFAEPRVLPLSEEEEAEEEQMFYAAYVVSKSTIGPIEY
ncbi:hypothetical protein EIP91_003759 [Steccherinum ochraceum]|uniref:Uncharacterized protein n=1 Tax=Steccherinum ochraceum TaxID=92696 RepID=A0A4R0RCJ1_9APHY|nr:hypothetical protein EIP91_003759 [Steccherinum ochraceum]